MTARSGGSVMMMFIIVSVTASPSKGRLPASASYKTTPREKMSLRASTGRPSACSGDM